MLPGMRLVRLHLPDVLLTGEEEKRIVYGHPVGTIFSPGASCTDNYSVLLQNVVRSGDRLGRAASLLKCAERHCDVAVLTVDGSYVGHAFYACARGEPLQFGPVCAVHQHVTFALIRVLLDVAVHEDAPYLVLRGETSDASLPACLSARGFHQDGSGAWTRRTPRPWCFASCGAVARRSTSTVHG